MKRRMRVLSIAVACSICISGCGKKEDKKEDKKDSEEKITLSFWENEIPKVQKVYDEIIKDFQKKNENITVKRTHYESSELKEGLSSEDEEDEKKKPDIVLISNENLGELAAAKIIAPVSKLQDEESAKNINKKAKEGIKFKGQEYMIPLSFNNQPLLIYNKKMVPEPPQTFNELVNTSMKLKNEKKVKYGLILNTSDPAYTLPFLGVFGGKVFDDTNPEKKKLTLDTTAAKEWMLFMKNLTNSEIIPPESDVSSAEETFKNGGAAFLIDSPQSLNDFERAGLDFGATTLPTINGKHPAPYSTVKGYVVSKTAEKEDKKDSVKKFLSFLTKKENSTKLALASRELPANTEVVKNDKIKKEPVLMMQMEQLDKSILLPVMAEIKAVTEAIALVQQDVLNGKIKPEDAPGRMQKKAEEKTKAAEKK